MIDFDHNLRYNNISFEGNFVCVGNVLWRGAKFVFADNTFIDLLLAASLLYDILNRMIVKTENPTTTG